MLSEAEKIQLVERASSLEERALGPFRAREDAPAALVESRFARWSAAVAKGDAPAFARYLSWRGLDEPSARRALGPVVWTGGDLPPWVHELEALLVAAADPVDSTAFAASPALAPFLAHAETTLRAELSERGLTVHPDLPQKMTASLLRWLRVLATPTLERELEVLREERGDVVATGVAASQRDPGASAAGPSDPFRDELSRRLRTGGWRKVLLQYPALARMTAQAVYNWRRGMIMFVERWQADRTEVTAAIFAGADPGELVDVQLQMSDPHRGGQAVVGLRFASGERVVYKPRSGALEDAYFALLAWLNAEGAPVPFCVLRVLERETHCWMEWLTHEHANGPDELSRFARSCGGILAVAHMLRVTDLHAENVIAAGPDAVVIDLETAVPPDLRLLGVDGDLPYLAQRNSVLRTALLPTELELGGAAIEIGAFGALLGMRPLDPQSSPVAVPENAAEPMRLSVPVAELAFLLEDGFAETYRFLLARREVMLAEGGAMAAFDRRPVRMIFRDTSIYQRIAMRSFQPQALRDGVDRSLELEVLKRPLRHLSECPPHFQMFEAEQRSIEGLDIPYFDARTDSHAVTADDGLFVPDVFHQSGYVGVVRGFAHWSEDDLAFQLELVRAATLGRFAEARHAEVVGTGSADATDLVDGSPYPRESLHALEASTADEPASSRDLATADGPATGGDASTAAHLLKAAAETVERLQTRAIATAAKYVTWIGPAPAPGRSGVRIGEIPVDFAEGVTGVLVFLGAHSRVTGDDRALDLARAAADWVSLIASNGPGRNRRDVSAATAGATAYALVRSAAWVGPTVQTAAAALMEHWVRVPPVLALVNANDAIGCVHGSLAMGSVLTGSDSDAALNGAVAWGRALLPSLPPGAPAHERAASALALAKLFAATGDSAFRESALRELRAAGSDFPRAAAPACRGAVAGASALEAYRVVGEAADAALARATLAAARSRPDSVDTLCCGSFGRIETLNVLSEILGRPELLDEATTRATEVIARAGADHVRFLAGTPRPLWSPSFLHGDAGVGYTLLRLTAPDVLPSLILWR